MVLQPIPCPTCGGEDVVKYGKTQTGKQRLLCQNPKCSGQTFVTDNAHKGRLPETKAQIISMSLNGSGIRDIARVLEISPATVVNEIRKKTEQLQAVETPLSSGHQKSPQTQPGTDSAPG